MIKKGWKILNKPKCPVCLCDLKAPEIAIFAVEIFGAKSWTPCKCKKSGVLITSGGEFYMTKEIMYDNIPFTR
jgi:hypothetical protein